MTDTTMTTGKQTGRWVDRPAFEDHAVQAAWLFGAIITVWRVMIYPHTFWMMFAATLDGVMAWGAWWVILTGIRRLDRGHVDVDGLPSPDVVETLAVGGVFLFGVAFVASLLRDLG